MRQFTNVLLKVSKSGLFSGLVRSLVNMCEVSGVAKNVTHKRPSEETSNENCKRRILESDRIKRKKVAMLIAYSGQGYLGMQRNPGMKTIEEDILQSLLKCGFITDEAFTTPQLIQFQRAARTDKGVSAVRQVISLKLPEEINIESINDNLPQQIRVLSFKRATKGFNSKASCNARTYSYMLPTFAFIPNGEEVNETYRITPEVIEEVNSTLKLFEGTHNFHNFTSRKRPMDPSAQRYLMKFTCGQPFVRGNMEFSVVEVKGQSFMLHQIRKMIGLTVAVCRGHTSVETIEKAWKPDRLDIPVAPGLGLILNEVHYDRYNQKYGNDGFHEALDWSDVEQEIKSFEEEHIFPTIIKTEMEEKSTLNWLLTLPFHSYDVREDTAESSDKQSFSVVDDEDQEARIKNGL